MAPEASSLFEVVGGAAKGGLVVRKGKGKGAEELSCRLSTGALVVALQQDDESERMLYELVEGTGPQSGWVNKSFKGKALLVPAQDEVSTEDAESLSEGDGTSSEQEEFTTELAMEIYSARLMEERSEELFEQEQSTNETVSIHDTASEHVKAEVRAALAFDEVSALSELKRKACRSRAELREEAEANKKAEREEYEIGWDAESHVKLNVTLTEKFGCVLPQGMCCVVLDKENRSAYLAPTLEPSASVNLEYLSTALEVRRRSGAEPRFSLDPANAGSEFFDPKHTMLVKRFEPAWLAGTSVGEVLFQSDYHLKELSMGEHSQPVVGMKSCADFSLGDDDRWNAREWYVVRRAEVRMSGDSVLMPHVKMGVEAREQVPGGLDLEDVPTTKPTHPMVRYAESFTKNFDLIAERKSVVHHLRELAKASVLAKFLMEADVELDDAWFNSTPGETDASALEIPQLWHACGQSEVSLYGGVQFGLDKFTMAGARQPARMLSAGLAARQFVQPARHLSATLSAGLATRQFQRSFGPLGVQPARVSAGIGLDKMAISGARQPARMLSAGLAARQFVQPARHLSATLSAGLATRQFQRSFGPLGVQPARVSAGVGLDKMAISGARQPARMLSAGLAARQFVQPARHLSATLSAGLATRQFQRSFGPLGVQPARVAGVDLNLDDFNLSAPEEEEDVCVRIDAGVDISGAFWSNLADELPSKFCDEDKALFNKIFNPCLSDRRQDGACFVPPDVSSSYIEHLRALVRDEETAQQKRKDHFLSKAFNTSEPGPFFPSSWATEENLVSKHVEPRPAFAAHAILGEAIAGASPVYEEKAEDGTRFRIYQVGNLEVRTVQEYKGREDVGAVFAAVA